MNQSIKLTKKEAAPFLQAAGIEYAGRKFHVEFTQWVSFYNTNWDGGSKNDYYSLSMSNSGSKQVPSPSPWCNPYEGAKVALMPDNLVVCHSHFCGQDCGITIYAHPSLAPKWLK
jgi:hypothetical protein